MIGDRERENEEEKRVEKREKSEGEIKERFTDEQSSLDLRRQIRRQFQLK